MERKEEEEEVSMRREKMRGRRAGWREGRRTRRESYKDKLIDKLICHVDTPVTRSWTVNKSKAPLPPPFLCLHLRPSSPPPRQFKASRRRPVTPGEVSASLTDSPIQERLLRVTEPQL